MADKHSKKLEEKAAKDITGGRRQIASGALPFWKNDIRGLFWLIEHKYTEAKSHSINRFYWNDIKKNAYKEGKLPAMIIEFENDPVIKLAVIQYEDFLVLDKYMTHEYEDYIIEE